MKCLHLYTIPSPFIPSPFGQSYILATVKFTYKLHYLWKCDGGGLKNGGIKRDTLLWGQ